MRSRSSGGQDLEQHVNGEIKRMATVTPTASIANVGNGLEMLGQKIGQIGSALNQRKKNMAFDRYQTDLQIKANNVMSDPESIRQMQNGEFNKVKDKLTKVFSDMSGKMTTEYDIHDERRIFELTKFQDVTSANLYSALQVKEVEYQDNLQKEQFITDIFNKKNLLIANMNSGDDVTAEANYKSALASLDSAVEFRLITPEQRQSILREFRRTRITGKVEKMAEEYYNAGNIEALNKLMVDADHSEFLFRNGGNGDERLGRLVSPYITQYNNAVKVNSLPQNIRDAVEYATSEAQKTGDDDWTKISNKKNSEWEKFLSDPILYAGDIGNISLENSGTLQNYTSDIISNVLRQYSGEKEYAEQYQNMSLDEQMNALKRIVVDNKGTTLYEAIDFSRDTTFGVDKDMLRQPNGVKALVDKVNEDLAGLPYELRRKITMDFAKAEGFSELDFFNNLNTSKENSYGGSIEQMKSYMQDKETSQGIVNEYEFQKSQRKKDDKKWKESDWQSFGFFGGIPKEYKKDYEYFMTLSEKDPRKMAVMELVNRCNALYTKTNDKDIVQQAYQQQIDNILGNDKVVEINDRTFTINKDFEQYLPAIKDKAKEILTYGNVFSGSEQLLELNKKSNLSANVFITPISDDEFMIEHKAYPTLNWESGEPIIIKISDIVREQEITRANFKEWGEREYREKIAPKIKGGK